ncbi:MAG: phosphoribosylformylglycinamidine cyclo-ligase [Clostridia bacterium]|jgi:phosphoribosylformylglycinamidine cyclo-ligase|nr:phosphoribosylformylglycinamidine cyclo-ligase [Clostridia bacterium]
MKSYSESYKEAGVDVTAGYESVSLMKEHVKKTFNPQVLQDIGGFGGLFAPDLTGIKTPVLVSGTDGVGTKLKLAFIMDKHDTIGIDCVAMCVNDVLCSGAKPLFFLDYIATGKLIPTKIADIVKGVSEGCLQASCALIGGETAEMPGFYPEDEYDLAGFTVGMVDKDKIIDGSAVKIGDALIGIASSGVHSNGFSLVRKLFGLNGEAAEKAMNTYYAELNSKLGETLLTPTKIYVKSVLNLIKKINIKAISHVTGGGFYENIPRMLPDLTAAKISKTFEIPPIFNVMQNIGKIPERDMFNTYNMGIGMVMAVDKENADTVIKLLKEDGEKAYIIGEVIKGDKEVIF